MRTVLSITGVCAALVMCAVSGAMNYLFLSSLGKTPLEGHVLGAASAAADLLKALLPFFIAWSWSARRFVAAVSGGVAFVFFAGFSLLSAIGFAADNRGVVVETRESITVQYERMHQDLRDADTRRAALPEHRPPSVVAEDIATHQQNRRWSGTTECKNATEAESRVYCERFFALRAEFAAGQEALLLAEKIASLQSQTQKLREAGAGLDRDPQVSLLSRIFGLEQETVRLTLIVVVALLVEIGSSLGLFLATGHGKTVEADVTKAPFGSVVLPTPSVPNIQKITGSVEEFCLSGLLPDENSEITMTALYAGYVAWCLVQTVNPVTEEHFEQSFTDLAHAVGLHRSSERFVGISLASARDFSTLVSQSDAMDIGAGELRGR